MDKSLEDLMIENVELKSKIEKLQEIWYSSQIGLIQVVSKICMRNSHMQIYASIRQEVLGQLLKKDSDGLRYEDKMLVINYKPEHLKQIFINAIKSFENETNYCKPELINSNRIEAFLGFNEVKALRIPNANPQDVFEYIYRHTIQRPRDIIYIGGLISKIPPYERNKYDIQRLINAEAEENLRIDYLKDLEKLMHINFASALSLINQNILKRNELINICEEYNKIENGAICNKECKNCNRSHLFCSLYNIGLLGIVVDDIEKRKIQKFLEPKNRKLIITSPIIPDSEVYLIHPVLNHWIEKLRKNKDKSDFIIFPKIIGDNCEYTSDYKEEIKENETKKDLEETREFKMEKSESKKTSKPIDFIYSSSHDKELPSGK